jgi:hypothetical protein
MPPEIVVGQTAWSLFFCTLTRIVSSLYHYKSIPETAAKTMDIWAGAQFVYVFCFLIVPGLWQAGGDAA